MDNNNFSDFFQDNTDSFNFVNLSQTVQITVTTTVDRSQFMSNIPQFYTDPHFNIILSLNSLNITINLPQANIFEMLTFGFNITIIPMTNSDIHNQFYSSSANNSQTF
jgi:hypothetical protein